MNSPDPVTLVVLVDIGPDGVDAFQRYETAVLALLERHRGQLERRLRTADGRSEVHIVSFASRAGYEAYLADPSRGAHRALVEGVPLTQRLLEVVDVAGGRSRSTRGDGSAAPA